MEVKEIMLLKAYEGIDMLLSKGQIDDTYIQLLYFIKSLNEDLNEDDNLVVGLSDKKMEEIFDEEDTDEPEILSMGEGLFKNLENYIKNSTIISIKDIDLEELFKKLNED